jgi:anti-anti-sigma factor
MSGRARGAADAILRIEGPMNIARAAELKPRLLEAMATGGGARLDLGEVSSIDTAGVQLLLMAQRWAQQHQRRLNLVASSRAVADTMRMLGFTQWTVPSGASSVSLAGKGAA